MKPGNRNRKRSQKKVTFKKLANRNTKLKVKHLLVTSKKVQKKRRKSTKKELFTYAWKYLPVPQKVERIQALEVLRRMRMGETLQKASREVGLSIKNVKNHLGNVLYKKKSKWLAKPQDKIQRRMAIYDRNSGKISITVKDSDDAARIGLYLALVNIALKEGKESIFKRLRDRSIKDIFGKQYRFETRLDRLYDLEDERENEEFFEIYSDE